MLRKMFFVSVSLLLWMSLQSPQIAQAACNNHDILRHVSTTSTGEGGSGKSTLPALSQDGRYIAFESNAENLHGGTGTSPFERIYIHDSQNCTTTLLSVSPTDTPTYGNRPSISADGRYVVFSSQESDHILNDTNGAPDVFMRDRLLNVTTIVSVTTSGAQSNSSSFLGSISADGSAIAFISLATNFDVGDTSFFYDTFVHDRDDGTTTRVSVATDGTFANGETTGDTPAISTDGRYVVFTASATNLVTGDTNDKIDVFLRDRQLNTTVRVSIADDESQSNADSFHPSISGDGRYIAFTSTADNLVPNDTDGNADVFVRDVLLNTTTLISRSSAGVQSSSFDEKPKISSDGRFIAFKGTGNGGADPSCPFWYSVYVHDQQNHTTHCVSRNLASEDTPVNADYGMSGDGLYIAFEADWTLLSSDTNQFVDIYVAYRPSMAAPNLIYNGAFVGPLSWLFYGTPTLDALQWRLADSSTPLEFYRTVGSESAVIFQNRDIPQPANSPLEATFQLGNTSGVRKRVAVLIHASDFSDLQVCSFWLPPNSPLRVYMMRTYTTQAWTGTSISFYAAVPDGIGWVQLDNVTLRQPLMQSVTQTFCYDPDVPALSMP